MTELNPTPIEEERVPAESVTQMDQSTEGTVTPVMYWGTIIQAAVMLLMSAISIIVAISLMAEGVPNSSTYISLVVIAVLAMINVASIVFTIRKRQDIGYGLSFFSLAAVPLSATLIVQGVALSLSFFFLVPVILGFWRMWSPRSRRFYTISAAVVLILIGVIEWGNPPWRTAYNGIQIGPIVAIFFAILVLTMIVRQAWIAGRVNFGLRLVTLMLVTALPIIAAALFFMVTRAASIIEDEGAAQLQKTNQAMTGNLEIWLNQQTETLNTLVSMPDIVSMDSYRQLPVLQTFKSGHPSVYLAHTMDMTGMNVARNDGGELRDYHDRGYFTGPVSGEPVVFQSLISRTTNQPAVCMGAPIHSGAGTLIGVGSLCSELTEITQGVQVIKVGQTGFAFVIDEKNQVVAHPDPTYTAELSDFSEYPPVAMLRDGQRGLVTFTDADGQAWHAYIEQLDNGWGVITQQPDAEYLATLTSFQTVSFIAFGIGIIIIVAVLWFTIRRAVQPVQDLTKAAEVISTGDLTQTIGTDRADEFGILAQTFDSMTKQLRELIGSLEQRVADRTRNLELAAEVGRSVSQVRALDVMLKNACQLILDEFELYYVQVYLTDPSQRNLVLEAGTGDVGAQLLGRGHRLPFNTDSINGRAAVEKRTIVISDTAENITFRPNELLPNTRGEMAVPLIVGEKVVGVLDMQSSEPGVLNEEILPAFEALAGQLAVTIQNAGLLLEAEQARDEVERQAARLVRTNWSEHLDAIHKPEQIGFMFDKNEVLPLNEVETESSYDGDTSVSSPIYLSGEELGSLVVEIDNEERKEQTSELVNIVARQVAQQIENLRLLESAERFRQEAEAASRRQTAEGWQAYVASRTAENLGYLYDLNQVRPHSNGQDDAAALTLPLKVRDEAIGKMAIQGVQPNDQEAFELVTAVAERLSAHIESLRQYDQTQSALAQSEKLFEASRSLTQATDLQELVAATVETLGVLAVNRAVLTAFDYDQDGEVEQLTIIANWWNGQGHEVTPLGTIYSLDIIKLMPMFVSPTPVFFNDAFADERVDETTMQLVKRQNLRAVAVLPLHLGSHQIGALILEAEEPHNFTPAETRLFISLAPQISTVLENRRQFERAQKQAERESMLNTISQKIQSATSVEAVLQIAARELGHALGAPMTIAQLSLKDKN